MQNSEVSQTCVVFVYGIRSFPSILFPPWNSFYAFQSLKNSLSHLLSSGIEGRNRKQRFSFLYCCLIPWLCGNCCWEQSQEKKWNLEIHVLVGSFSTTHRPLFIPQDHQVFYAEFLVVISGRGRVYWAEWSFSWITFSWAPLLLKSCSH